MTSTPPTKQIPSIKDIFPNSQPKTSNPPAQEQERPALMASTQAQDHASINQHNKDTQAPQARAESFLASKQQQSQQPLAHTHHQMQLLQDPPLILLARDLKYPVRVMLVEGKR